MNHIWALSCGTIPGPGWFWLAPGSGIRDLSPVHPARVIQRFPDRALLL